MCASDSESLPRVILEAMAFVDAAVVSTDAFGIPEVIEDGQTGYLCRPRDERALADALDHALSAGSERREKIVAAAAARVRERHDADDYAIAFERLALDVTSGSVVGSHAVLGVSLGHLERPTGRSVDLSATARWEADLHAISAVPNDRRDDPTRVAYPISSAFQAGFSSRLPLLDGLALGGEMLPARPGSRDSPA